MGDVFICLVGEQASWINCSLILTCLHALIAASLLLLPPSPYELARAGSREGVRAALTGLRGAGEGELEQELENVFR